MPNPSMTAAQREKQRRALSKAITASGRSMRRAAAEVAAGRGANPATIWKNFQRWLAETPRPGAIDAAPAWAVDAVEALPPLPVDTISQQLRAAVAAKHVSLALAQRAADALAAVGK